MIHIFEKKTKFKIINDINMLFACNVFCLIKKFIYIQFCYQIQKNSIFVINLCFFLFFTFKFILVVYINKKINL